jgi:hypothetical protein
MKNEKIRSLIAAARDNPRTSILGVVAVALYGAGEGLREHAIEPWGSIVVGIGGLVVLVSMFWARDPK